MGLSPDGRRVAYVTCPAEYGAKVTCTARTNTTAGVDSAQTIELPGSAETISWSPDSRTVAIYARSAGIRRLWLWTVGDSRARDLTPAGEGLIPVVGSSEI